MREEVWYRFILFFVLLLLFSFFIESFSCCLIVFICRLSVDVERSSSSILFGPQSSICKRNMKSGYLLVHPLQSILIVGDNGDSKTNHLEKEMKEHKTH